MRLEREVRISRSRDESACSEESHLSIRFDSIAASHLCCVLCMCFVARCSSVYFADKFSKSLGYCREFYGSFGNVTGALGANGRYQQQSQPSSAHQSRCLLLCEVALGVPHLAHTCEYMERSPEGTHSTHAVASSVPDPLQTIITKDGMRIPCGKIVTVQQPKEWDNAKQGSYFCTDSSEFIVYNEGQVRMRYLVQVGNPRPKYIAWMKRQAERKARKKQLEAEQIKLML